MRSSPTTALALFSGGLDSIVSCRVMMEQGIRVKAVKFVSPFFGYDLLAREQEYAAEIHAKYGIDLCLRDISKPYIEMLGNPPHGYGKNFNPCIDCKILLFTEARKMMPEWNASLLISGEVIGQRPMSQRSDTLRLIERDSGCDGILLRPLCAKKQPPTIAEKQGLVDRDKLHDLYGRGRHGQIALAAHFGISDYPAPAGGCVLTDPIKSKQIARYYAEEEEVRIPDLLMLQVGRQFMLPNGGWLALGRDEKENPRIAALAGDGDILLQMDDRPGPTALLRRGSHPETRKIAAAIVLRYARKDPDGPTAGTVNIFTDQRALEDETPAERITVEPLAEERIRSWQR
ncbi:MAG: thiamine biosynthesis protein [Desulfobulbaceae bacterium]|nr:thiamine biosynthesis protein [Desulfobulbaceae bacterium]